MAQSRLEILLQATVDGLDKVAALKGLFRQLTEAMQEATKSTAGFGSVLATAVSALTGIGAAATVAITGQKDLAESFGTVHTSISKVEEGLKLAAAALLAYLGIKGLQELVDEASASERLALSLSVVAANTGITKTETDAYVKSLTDIGFTAESAEKALAKLIQTGVDLSATNEKGITTAVQLGKLAQNLSATTGQSEAQALDLLTFAIARQSDRMLRQIGLRVDLVAAEKKYADQVGKTVAGLDSEDKAQAFTNALLDQAGKTTGLYAQFLETAAGKVSNLQTAEQNLRTVLGEQLLPAYKAILDATTESVAHFNELVVAAGKTGEVSALLGQTFRDLGTGVTAFVNSVLDFFDSLFPELSRFGLGLGGLSEALLITASSAIELVTATSILKLTIGGIASVVELVASTLLFTASAIALAVSGYTRLALVVTNARIAILEFNGDPLQQLPRLREQQLALGALADRYEELGSKAEEAAVNVGFSALGLTQSSKEIAAAFLQLDPKTFEGFQTSIASLNKEVSNGRLVAQDAAPVIRQWRDSISDARVASTITAAQLVELNAQLDLVTRKSTEAGEAALKAFKTTPGELSSGYKKETDDIIRSFNDLVVDARLNGQQVQQAFFEQIASQKNVTALAGITNAFVTGLNATKRSAVDMASAVGTATLSFDGLLQKQLATATHAKDFDVVRDAVVQFGEALTVTDGTAEGANAILEQTALRLQKVDDAANRFALTVRNPEVAAALKVLGLTIQEVLGGVPPAVEKADASLHSIAVAAKGVQDVFAKGFAANLVNVKTFDDLSFFLTLLHQAQSEGLKTGDQLVQLRGKFDDLSTHLIEDFKADPSISFTKTVAALQSLGKELGVSDDQIKTLVANFTQAAVGLGRDTSGVVAQVGSSVDTAKQAFATAAEAVAAFTVKATPDLETLRTEVIKVATAAKLSQGTLSDLAHAKLSDPAQVASILDLVAALNTSKKGSTDLSAALKAVEGDISRFVDDAIAAAKTPLDFENAKATVQALGAAFHLNQTEIAGFVAKINAAQQPVENLSAIVAKAGEGAGVAQKAFDAAFGKQLVSATTLAGLTELANQVRGVGGGAVNTGDEMNILRSRFDNVVSSDALKKFKDGTLTFGAAAQAIRDAGKAVGATTSQIEANLTELGQVNDEVQARLANPELASTLDRLKVSFSEFTSHITPEIQTAVDKLGALGDAANITGAQIAQVASLDLVKAKTIEDVVAYNDRLIELGKSGKDVGDALAVAGIKADTFIDSLIKNANTGADFTRARTAIVALGAQYGQSSAEITLALSKVTDAQVEFQRQATDPAVRRALADLGTSFQELDTNVSPTTLKITQALQEMGLAANVTADEFNVAFSKNIVSAKTLDDLAAFQKAVDAAAASGKTIGPALDQLSAAFAKVFDTQLKAAATAADFDKLRQAVVNLGSDGKLSLQQMIDALDKIDDVQGDVTAGWVRMADAAAKAADDTLKVADAALAVGKAQRSVGTDQLALQRAIADEQSNSNDLSRANVQVAQAQVAVDQEIVKLKQAQSAEIKAQTQLTADQAALTETTAKLALDSGNTELQHEQQIGLARVAADQGAIDSAHQLVDSTQKEVDTLQDAVDQAQSLANTLSAASNSIESISRPGFSVAGINIDSVTAQLQSLGLAAQDAQRIAASLFSTFGQGRNQIIGFGFAGVNALTEVENAVQQIGASFKQDQAAAANFTQQFADVKGTAEAVATAIVQGTTATTGLARQGVLADAALASSAGRAALLSAEVDKTGTSASALVKAFQQVRAEVDATTQSAKDAVASFLSNVDSIHTELLKAEGDNVGAAKAEFDARKNQLAVEEKLLEIKIQIAIVEAKSAGLTAEANDLQGFLEQTRKGFAQAESDLNKLEALQLKSIADTAAANEKAQKQQQSSAAKTGQANANATAAGAPGGTTGGLDFSKGVTPELAQQQAAINAQGHGPDEVAAINATNISAQKALEDFLQNLYANVSKASTPAVQSTAVAATATPVPKSAPTINLNVDGKDLIDDNLITRKIIPKLEEALRKSA